MAADYRSIISKGWHGLTVERLYEETIGHIAEEHAEFRLQLPSQLEGLMNAIAAPTAIHVSTTDPVRSVVLVSDGLTYFQRPGACSGQDCQRDLRASSDGVLF